MVSARAIRPKISFLITRLIVPAILKYLFVLFPRRKKTLLIVKTDGIGDYILFRNFLRFLKESERYKHHKIYLAANLNTQNLAVNLDAEFVSGFFWYSESYLLSWNLIKFIYAIQKLRVETILYPNYSRKFIIDWLVNTICAANKIAVDGDCINQPSEIKNKTNKYYSELITVSQEPMHDFERNKLIFEKVAAQKCTIEKPEIDKKRLNIVYNNVVVFQGASTDDKKWPAAFFNNLCKRIIKELKTSITLAGGKAELNDGLVISEGLSKEYLVDKSGINLIGLCELIAGSRLLISGDTVAVHMAAALDIPVVCIAKGDLYGRFVPYPANIFDKMTVIFPPAFLPDTKKYDCYSSFSLDQVQLVRVFDAASEILNKKQVTA